MENEARPKSTNWVLWIAIIGLLFVLTPVACCGGLGFFVFSTVKAPLTAAVDALESDVRVTDRIGMPISYDSIQINNMNTENGEGSADINTNFSGPKGTVHVEGSMKQTAGQWSPAELTVTFDDDSTIRIP